MMQPNTFHTLPPEITSSVGDHVEQPLRIDRIYRALKKHGFISRMKKINCRPVTREEVLLVHTRSLWEKVQALASLTPDQIRDKEGYYEAMSLYVCPDTTRAAKYSCGGVIEAALSVARGDVKRSFAIVRPPGHHAEPRNHMGFCFFNNIAIAAKVVQRRTALTKILIIDWDVHHGNGTHLAFNDDPTVLYISLHRWEGGDFYPHGPLGGMESCGVDAGLGYSVNIPWSEAGMSDAEYMFAFEHMVMPIAAEFDPDLVLISAGFDAAAGDELGECHVSPNGFGRMTESLCTLAEGRVVVALEGGYNLESMSESAVEVVRALFDEKLQLIRSPTLLKDSAVDTVWMVALCQSWYWRRMETGCKIPDFFKMSEEAKKARSVLVRRHWIWEEARRCHLGGGYKLHDLVKYYYAQWQVEPFGPPFPC